MVVTEGPVAYAVKARAQTIQRECERKAASFGQVQALALRLAW